MIEALWAALVAGIRAKGALKPSLALVDVSGSMTGYVCGSDGGTVGMAAPWAWRACHAVGLCVLLLHCTGCPCRWRSPWASF